MVEMQSSFSPSFEIINLGHLGSFRIMSIIDSGAEREIHNRHEDRHIVR